VTCIIAASFITVIAVAIQPREHLMKAGKPIVWYAFNRNATLSDVVSNKQSENDDSELTVILMRRSAP
jgi:hypothetical protein